MDKQHILAEIKRTADANAGIPLGRTKFYQNTGIKESDWAGIHWARWGDVIKEAGYKPNKLQEAHPEDYLLEQYVRTYSGTGADSCSLQTQCSTVNSTTQGRKVNMRHIFVMRVCLISVLFGACNAQQASTIEANFSLQLPPGSQPGILSISQDKQVKLPAPKRQPGYRMSMLFAQGTVRGPIFKAVFKGTRRSRVMSTPSRR